MAISVHGPDADQRISSAGRGVLTTSGAVRLLFVLSIAFAALSLTGLFKLYLGSEGVLEAPGKPFGGDFVNLWTTGKLVLARAFDDIYRVASFDAFQETLTGEHIGYRLWAYPPHSLILAGPFGLGNYYLTYVGWTLLGLAVLVAGGRRVGFNWTQTGILALSPASMQCIVDGQTGNLATGLLLFALAATPTRMTSSALAGAILTIKPQAGFLLPLLWVVERRWKLILTTGALTLVLVAASVAIFGMQSWTDYLGDTLPGLSRLEREGTGPFLYMIPSVFISLRLLGAEADLASAIHLPIAGLVFVLLGWRLLKVADTHGRAALVLIGTCLITPYLHLYDLSILLAGALLLAQPSNGRSGTASIPVLAAIVLAWLLPMLVMPLGRAGFPIAPGIIAVIFLVACTSTGRRGPPSLPRAVNLSA